MRTAVVFEVETSLAERIVSRKDDQQQKNNALKLFVTLPF
jgi:hypothetical protein